MDGGTLQGSEEHCRRVEEVDLIYPDLPDPDRNSASASASGSLCTNENKLLKVLQGTEAQDKISQPLLSCFSSNKYAGFFEACRGTPHVVRMPPTAVLGNPAGNAVKA